MKKLEITISDKLKKIHDNGIIIYPKFNLQHKFAVVVEDSRNAIYANKKTIGEYKHDNKSINDAIMKTLEHVYNRLTNK